MQRQQQEENCKHKEDGVIEHNGRLYLANSMEEVEKLEKTRIQNNTSKLPQSEVKPPKDHNYTSNAMQGIQRELNEDEGITRRPPTLDEVAARWKPESKARPVGGSRDLQLMLCRKIYKKKFLLK